MPPDSTPIRDPVKRVSLVRFRRDLDRDACVELWFGEHAQIVQRLPQVREYTVDVFPHPVDDGGWDAIATLRFDSDADLRASIGDPEIAAELLRTRDDFLETAEVMIVQEHRLVAREVSAA
jgi:uncharacterized protein (TIGR02118 family)